MSITIPSMGKHVLPSISLPSITPRKHLMFYLNNELVVIKRPDPGMTLATYLREVKGLTGTKIGCGEGGCGACTVILTFNDACTLKTVTTSINACLRPLCSCDSMSITTIEGLGGSKSAFSDVQKVIADGNGLQCGFCTPGWVCNYSGFIASAKAAGQPISDSDIERQADGNLCRCTGYRPILDAMKSLVKQSRNCSDDCSTCPRNNNCGAHNENSVDFEDMYKKVSLPIALAKSAPSAVYFPSISEDGTGLQWFKPISLAQLIDFSLTCSIPMAPILGQTARAVAKYFVQESSPSCTVGGFSMYNDQSVVLVDISSIPEMKSISSDATNGISVGGGVTLSYLFQTVYDAALSWGGESFDALQKHINKVSSSQIRHSGGWAGNLMLHASHPSFPSDIVITMITMNASVDAIIHGNVCKNIPLEDYINYVEVLIINSGSKVASVGTFLPILTGLHIPPPLTNQLIKTHKIMRRRCNSHPIVNAGFRVQFVSNPQSAVTAASLIYGGAGKRIFRAKLAEAYLIGKVLNSQSMNQALALVELDLNNIGVNEHTFDEIDIEFRKSLIQTLLYKFFLSCQPTLPSYLQSAVEDYVRPISSGSQTFPPANPSLVPISAAIPKVEGRLLASGESKFASDEGINKKCLYGALVGTTQATGTLVSFDISEAMKIAGVSKVIDATHIPAANDIGAPGDSEYLFIPIGGNISCCAQSIALVVADSAIVAQQAAKLVKVVYSSGDKPILTLREAMAANRFYDLTGMLPPIDTGGVDEAIAAAKNIVAGEISADGQRHFYMETQSTYCSPNDDGSISVISSTQATLSIQGMLSAVLGIKENDIDVSTKRSGGGFGGKLTRNLPVAGASAVAAWVMNTPISVQNERVHDVNTTGGREPMIAQYKCAYDDTGKITVVDLKLYFDGGSTIDASAGSVAMALLWCDGSYFSPKFRAVGMLAKTDVATNTAMRAPGAVSSLHAMECIIEHVAFAMGKSVDDIRPLNFYKEGNVTPYGQTLTYVSLPDCWNQILVSSDYQARKDKVNQYNHENRWKKRGIAINPTKYGIGAAGYQTGAALRVFAADGSIIISHGGCEIGQGINTKVAQTVAKILSVPMDIIRVIGSETTLVANAQPTGGSITSPSVCAAAEIACNTLLARLADAKKANPSAAWGEVIAAAAASGVSLNVESWYLGTGTDAFNYYTYGTSVSEVEIDVLTGEVSILQSDVLMDLGVSFNPAVDIGQIEGAFIQGVGLYLTEEVIYNTDGSLQTTGTWEYKVPSALDIPIKFNISLLANSSNPYGFKGSKAVGEPPFALSCSVYFAVRNAILAARSESVSKPSDFFITDVPSAPRRIQTNCLVTTDQFELS